MKKVKKWYFPDYERQFGWSWFCGGENPSCVSYRDIARVYEDYCQPCIIHPYQYQGKTEGVTLQQWVNLFFHQASREELEFYGTTDDAVHALDVIHNIMDNPDNWDVDEDKLTCTIYVDARGTLCSRNGDGTMELVETCTGAELGLSSDELEFMTELDEDNPAIRKIGKTLAARANQYVKYGVPA